MVGVPVLAWLHVPHPPPHLFLQVGPHSAALHPGQVRQQQLRDGRGGHLRHQAPVQVELFDADKVEQDLFVVNVCEMLFNLF